MRIGIDCRLYSSAFTGIGRYTHELVDHIIKLNSDLQTPHKIILFFNGPEYRNFKIDSPHVEKIRVNSKHYSLSEQTKFAFKLYRAKLDVVHFPHFNVPILYRKKYIVTIHDLILSYFPGQKMTKFYHRLAYHLTIKNATRTAKKIITISNHTKLDLQKQLKVREEKISVIYNGLNKFFHRIEDPHTFDKTLKKHGITKEFFLYTGVWRNHKNLPNLLKAFKILREETNLHFQLVITGKPDPHYPEVKDTIHKLQLQDDVVLPGLVPEDELLHLYNAAKFYIFPSLYEGFGLPPLEAMACGTPVLASHASSIPEVCGSNNAIFFDPHDPADIAEQIQMLYKDIEHQAELIERGLHHIKDFDWSKTAAQTFQLIQNV